MPRVVVFHTSDLHNKLTHETAGILRELKASVPESLMLDSGDALRAGNIFWLPGGEPILDLMNSVPYDAMCMGNREYHFLRAGLIAKTSRTKFPILSANLQAAKPGIPLSVEPWIVLEHSGLRIGILGLTIPCITEQMMVKKIADYYFTDPTEAAKAFVPELRDRCDVLVALTHLSAGTDRDLAAKVHGIDVILAGHSHTTPEPEQMGGTMIFRHGAYAHYVGRVTIDVEGGQVTATDELIPLGKA